MIILVILQHTGVLAVVVKTGGATIQLPMQPIKTELLRTFAGSIGGIGRKIAISAIKKGSVNKYTAFLRCYNNHHTLCLKQLALQQSGKRMNPDGQ